MSVQIKVCENCNFSKETYSEEVFCSRCGNRYPSTLTKTLDNINDEPFVFIDRNQQENEPKQQDARNKLSLFGEKVKGFGKQVASTAKSTVSTVTETASIVGTNIQGTFAPTSMKREGYLWKMNPPSVVTYPPVQPPTDFNPTFYPPPAIYPPLAPIQLPASWTQYYFVFRDGLLHVLPSQASPKSDISFSIEQIDDVRKIDPLETGQPNCFRICVNLQNESFKSDFHRSTVYSFLGIPIMTSTERQQTINEKMILAAPCESDRDNWVRELKVAVDALKFRTAATDLGKSTLDLGIRVGAGTLAVVAGSTVGSRAGRKVANAIIK
eukprot:TRINITY_DN5202_c0_g1_i1.p1 TRINITY_DN5202_c0_g1~~TRINITY_DN5202_c0_g1_i1.p1  ORF type:complete len:345 (-),score=77.29 TRINITY_DN5202_c0_g1_i1:162-1136(-)